MSQKRDHWQRVYDSKEFKERSWFQEVPVTSLEIIEDLDLPKKAAIIDIGGGESYLTQFLLEKGYQNLSILDISEKALRNSKMNLGSRAKEVNYIVSDVTSFNPDQEYELWHDRAAFHFLTEAAEISDYKKALLASLKVGGYFILGTFSEKGPAMCSGLPVNQYSKEEMRETFKDDFEVIELKNAVHATPWDAPQDFTFGIFRKK